MAVENQSSKFEPKPFGRYVLVDKLAVGGMAEIYKAKTYGVDGFEKLLAIKRILPHCAADKEFISMLVDEAKLTVLLSHANIVQVFDLGKVGDDYFISMEFINGTNLRELLGREVEKDEKISEPIAVYIMSELCKGLDYAHRKTDSQGNPLHIVHRDISPQNILLSFEGEVKIVDFGIAKAAMNVSHTMAGILKGKIAYMSPEQALGKPIDHRTDIFSAGVLLYEMFTGEKLFTGETQFEVLNQIRTTRINTLMLPDNIPGPLKAILAKALAYNVKDRYQSAGDFQLDLTKYLYSSYIDFSPRHLAEILKKLFPHEMRREAAISAAPIDEKTRSVLVKQSGLENIVVHGAPKAAEVIPQDQTAVTGPYAEPTERNRKARRKTGILAAGGVAAVLVIGFLAYHFLVKTGTELPSSKPTEAARISKPATPQSPTSAVPGEDLGSIVVTTNPAGAKILLNGQETGLATPATLSKLAVGDDYQIQLDKENYRSIYKAVSLTSTNPVILDETLQALARGVIEIDSNPRGARIFLNDKDSGLVTPAKVENLEIQKSYPLKLSAPNFYDWSGTVEVKDLTPVKLQASLTPVAPATAPPTAALPPAQAPTPAVQAPPTPAPQTPAQPEKPVVSYGRIRVTSEPAGARILLNGQGTGKSTPATLEGLEAGKRMTIGLVKNGFKDWSRAITVEGNKTAPLIAALKEVEAPKPETPPPPPKQEAAIPPPQPAPQPPKEEMERIEGAPGSLSISSDPSGAEVYINSEYKGTTPLKASVNPGGVRLVVSKEGYMRYTASLRLSPGENKSLGTIKLGDPYGEVSIQSSPPRASVVFDGESIGARTPVTIRRVPRDRSHSLRVQLDGYRSWETTVNLKDQGTKKYDVMLEKD